MNDEGGMSNERYRVSNEIAKSSVKSGLQPDIVASDQTIIKSGIHSVKSRR